MFKKIFSEKRILVNNLSDKSISEVIKELQGLQDQGYDYLSVEECWGGVIKPYSFRNTLEEKSQTQKNLESLIQDVNTFKNKLRCL